MGLSLTKCTREVNEKFLQISKLLSARLTQGLPDAERSCSKLRKLRNVLPPSIPVNTSWKKIQRRGEVSKTILYCASSPWTRVWQISTSEVSSVSQTQPTPYPHVLRLVWSSEPSGEYPDSAQNSYNFRGEKQNCESVFGKTCLPSEQREKLNLLSLMKRR